MPHLLGLTLLLGVTAGAVAQDPPSLAEQKRGSRQAPTHAPQPELPPALVLAHVRQGNAATVIAIAAGKRPPAPRPRPAGAGRYVCAVLVCADADLEVAPLLGLRRRDVLVISAPGPFVQAEAVALLEHCAAQERLPLAIVLTHPRCATAALPRGGTPHQSATAERIALARRSARRQQCPLPRALARGQRELLVASSELLQHAIAADRLRILPAEVDGRTGQITWHTSRADELPMAPIK